MTYFLLLERSNELPGRPWVLEFGDHDKATVEYEREDYRDRGTPARDLKLVSVKSAHKSACDAAVAKLNGAAK